MKWLIDGYNLLGQTPSLSFSDSDKEHRLLNLIERVMGTAAGQVCVVFDGHQDHWASTHHSQHNLIKVIFTSPGYSADAEIIKRIGQIRSSKSTVVVTSDREIADYAKRAQILIIKSENFWYDCNRRFHTHSTQEKTDSPIGKRELAYWLKEFGQ